MRRVTSTITFAVILLASLLSAFADKPATEDFTLKHRFGPDRIEFTFSFEFVPLDGSDVGLDRIVVGLPGRKQTLRIDFLTGEFGPERLRKATRFTDLNGDGFDDLLVPTYCSPMGNNGFFVWVYSPETAEFIYCWELSAESNLEAMGDGSVETYSRDGGPTRTSRTFQWTGRRFELIDIYRHEERDGKVFETLRSKKDGKWVEDFARPLEHH